MKKSRIVNMLIPAKKRSVGLATATAYAPANIALCKYWGKRDQELNLPQNSSLSISLGEKGANTKISLADSGQDEIILNQIVLPTNSEFVTKIKEFLDLFRFVPKTYYHVEIEMNIPIAAGLASSACGFASLVLALNQLYAWHLSDKALSILARLGSGSACRSLWSGFVEWRAGKEKSGMDSYAKQLSIQWPQLCIGLLILSAQKKYLSSREAMKETVATSPFYSDWLKKAKRDLADIKGALEGKNFLELGKIAESNALAMHATMTTAWPPINFSLPETVVARNRIWQLRKEGLSLFFTQDAGPNLKLLFLEKEIAEIKKHFPSVEVIAPFKKS